VPLLHEQKSEISELLKSKIRSKLEDYSPEPNSMPFHTRLLGGDRMAIFSFIQSVNTILGTSVFEQIAAITARPIFNRLFINSRGLIIPSVVKHSVLFKKSWTILYRQG